jgi:hypothetical protein
MLPVSKPDMFAVGWPPCQPVVPAEPTHDVALVVDQVMTAEFPGPITAGMMSIWMVGAATVPTVTTSLAAALPPEPLQVSPKL